MVKGVLDKKSIGAEQVDSLWHRIARDYPPEVARRWLDSSLRLFLRYLDLRGFTFGMDSIYLPPEAYKEINKIVEESLKKVEKLIDDFRNGRLEAMPGFTVEETFENKVTEILSRVREEAAVVVEKNIDKNSEGYLMAKTGARGSIVNIVQMVATLGQQTIRGERIRRGFRTRTLPHFPVGDIGAFSGGFVRSCFRYGLTPVEYFFHAAAGRDGLIDTAVRTAQSGYMQRRLINALQDVYVAYDGTVRFGGALLLQLLYGEDGVDVSRSDHGKVIDIRSLKLSMR
jgi:DNA-directed RNA polymerase subunit A'